MPRILHTVERYAGEDPFASPPTDDPRFMSFVKVLTEHGVLDNEGRVKVHGLTILRGVGPDGFLYNATWHGTAWFTFGWGQTHDYGGRTLDRNTVVKITAPDPRKRMIELFGNKWAMQYDEQPDMKYYKEIVEIE